MMSLLDVGHFHPLYKQLMDRRFPFLFIFVGEVVLFNIFYEVFTVCTSVVAEDTKGQSTPVEDDRYSGPNGEWIFLKNAYVNQLCHQNCVNRKPPAWSQPGLWFVHGVRALPVFQWGGRFFFKYSRYYCFLC